MLLAATQHEKEHKCADRRRLSGLPVVGSSSGTAGTKDTVDHAQRDGHAVITVPERVKDRIHSLTDVQRKPVRDWRRTRQSGTRASNSNSSTRRTSRKKNGT